MRKIYGIILAFIVTTQVVNARNNATLFGVAAAAIAGAALIANSHRVPRHHYVPRRRYHHPKKRVKKIVITDEMKIQQSLKYMDFYHGKIDGKINSYATRRAIKRLNREYQINNGTSLDQKSWNQLLYLSELFQMDKDLYAKGDSQKIRGKRLQTALKVFGAYESGIDGIVGNGTRRAIAIYKQREGLSPNTSLSSNERYNLINSAQKMNSEAIDEAIMSISRRRQVPQKSTHQEPARGDKSIPSQKPAKTATKHIEKPKSVDDDELSEMERELNSIDEESNKNKKGSELEGFE
jgi:peptidoglycan hydrolase-like protein with peptidoglycan-binding domain